MRGMVWLLFAVLVLGIVLLVVRWRLVHRAQSPLDPEPFDGHVYRIGDATVLATLRIGGGGDENDVLKKQHSNLLKN